VTTHAYGNRPEDASSRKRPAPQEAPMKTYRVRGVDYVHLPDGNVAGGFYSCTRCPAAPIDDNGMGCKEMQLEAGLNPTSCVTPTSRSFVPLHEYVAWRLTQRVT